jgi:hypothetical protein
LEQFKQLFPIVDNAEGLLFLMGNMKIPKQYKDTEAKLYQIVSNLKAALQALFA